VSCVVRLVRLTHGPLPPVPVAALVVCRQAVGSSGAVCCAAPHPGLCGCAEGATTCLEAGSQHHAGVLWRGVGWGCLDKALLQALMPLLGVGVEHAYPPCLQWRLL
jgi:hypothetical protein